MGHGHQGLHLWEERESICNQGSQKNRRCGRWRLDTSSNDFWTVKKEQSFMKWAMAHNLVSFCCRDKMLWPEQFTRGRVCLAYTSGSQPITEGSEDKNLRRTQSRTRGGIMLFGSFTPGLMFRELSWTAQAHLLGLVPPIVGWALSYQLAMKTTLYRHASLDNWNFLFQGDSQQGQVNRTNPGHTGTPLVLSSCS